jgi:hypothetical protein
MSADTSEAAFLQKQKAVQASLDAQDDIVIHAVIGADGPRGSKSGGETHWPLCLDVIAWRVPEGPVQRGDLLFDQHASDAELAALQGAIATESMIAFSAKLCECSHFGDTRARFLDLLPTPCDDKLEAILFDYRKRIVMVDPLLGELVFDTSAEQFVGTINWLGSDVRVEVSTDEHGDAADALATAKILMSDMGGWTRKVNAFAAAKLLEMLNDGWLDEDEAPVTHEQFVERMQFDSLIVDRGGHFTFWHLDGGLFCGHYIQICGSLDEGLTDADIPG